MAQRLSSGRALPLVLACLLLASCGREAPPRELVLLAEPGPWSWVSRMVGYRGRLWLVNSELGSEHATADLYSYDPRIGAVRYEGHLFSQETGRPAVAGGLLFWPHEDSRYHLGLGHLSVTDGERFALRAIPGPRLGHVHALAPWRGGLVASASLVRPVLLGSRDLGGSWRVLHRAPEGRRRIARILRLATAGGRLFGYLVDGIQVEQRRTLVEVSEGGMRRVPGWPEGEIRGLAGHGGRAWAVVEADDGPALWSTDGLESLQHEGPPAGRLRDVASGGAELWALTLGGGATGQVWRRTRGGRWTLYAGIAEGRPHELALLGGEPYVGGRETKDGRGALWGPRPPAPAGPEAGQAPWPPPQAGAWAPGEAPAPVDWDAERVALRRALRDPASYADGLAPFAARVARLAAAPPPPGFFEGLLAENGPPGSVRLLEKAPEVPAAPLARWVVLWGIALAGRGAVPVDFLAEPYVPPPWERAKSFQPLLAALAAVAATGQGDPATVETLVARLRAGSDPDWLRADVVAALTAATGQRLGHDAAAWIAWWDEERPDAR